MSFSDVSPGSLKGARQFLFRPRNRTAQW
ncbi:hypothetical protein D2N39_07190 [Gemmobacter lutimaris]|uniref:Neuromedin U C-terminal domain-containing protein n=1 Tax=Gemmobacter lutimaris TaxID=2306023 RepID=A0A398BRN7_9RHOB|nr:hypothetical protein D2N39_07190 [Gemmobacter lutimaris]